MAKIKLAKTAVESAQAQAQAVELRDTVVPGFLCRITPAGREVFMLQYRTNAGSCRKPALGPFGELTVEQARIMAQDWLAEVRRGGDRAEAGKAPTIAELCKQFMEDYSSKRNKPSTPDGYQAVINRNVIPLLGRKKVHEVKRPDIANSGVPIKVGMELTQHKTVVQFMHYVHTEDKPVRDAAELVASRRTALTSAARTVEAVA
uniref:integrase arm-type DNA-binding domain-containing protein n=1 Tax=Burkholderia anthina TaxID=179879 RepID=UPI00158ACFC6|nr:integrase arm-type DNA-binding domain-containing protein [Burkholderia anthina]